MSHQNLIPISSVSNGALTLIDIKHDFKFCLIDADKNKGMATPDASPHIQSLSQTESPNDIKIKMVDSQYAFLSPKNIPVVISFVCLSPFMSGIVVFINTAPTAKKYGNE